MVGLTKEKSELIMGVRKDEHNCIAKTLQIATYIGNVVIVYTLILSIWHCFEAYDHLNGSASG